MILFLKDWAKYPTAIVDTTTRNTSWIRYVSVLKAMGVKNHAWPLALINPDLQGLDPHSLDLTATQMASIWLECYMNPWYCFREVMKIPAKAGVIPDPIEANRGIMAVWWCAFNHVDVANTQPRQTGKSTGAFCLQNYTNNIRGQNAKLMWLTKDSGLRSEHVDEMKKYREALPAYIAMLDKKDKNNESEVTNVRLNNLTMTAVSQMAEAAALKLGRGFTVENIVMDESPYVEHMDIVFPQMTTASAAVRETAKRNGALYFSVYPTTAGKINTKSGGYMYALFNGGMQWNESLLDSVDEADLVQRVRKGSKGLKSMVYIDLLHYQLGKTDEWLYNRLADSNSTGEDADRDYFNRWTSGSGSHPIPVDLLEMINKSRTDPVEVELSSNAYCINWYISAEELENRIKTNQMMVGGVDSSEGMGRDNISLTIVCESTLETLGTMVVSETNIPIYADWLLKLMVKYPNLILNIEARSSGVFIIDWLLTGLSALGIDPFKRLYNRVVDEYQWNKSEYELLNTHPAKRGEMFYTKCKGVFGFRTSGSGIHARSELYERTLQRAARYTGTTIRDIGLIREILALVVRDGRIDHKAGGHDDRVVSWLLAVWMIMYSKNLNYYDIFAPLYRAVDYKRQELDKEKTHHEKARDHQQEWIKEQITVMGKMLNEEEDNNVAHLIELKIRNLYRKLKNEDDVPQSVDSYLKNITQARKSRFTR